MSNNPHINCVVNFSCPENLELFVYNNIFVCSCCLIFILFVSTFVNLIVCLYFYFKCLPLFVSAVWFPSPSFLIILRNLTRREERKKGK